ncbi:RidA family protein [Robertkochia flava]|uniref:RidA family protein n=1 Tax=Robertkochia flava TaxID=3447986 RepID=UPI001CCEE715|nr:RidA family protein [Robertkochia marina]
MKTRITFTKNRLLLALTFFTVLLLQGCLQIKQDPADSSDQEPVVKIETPEYFQLRPEVEKAYGYTHAVKIGNDIKISGAVSMDEEGNPTAAGDLEQQMKNCYADLEKILTHFGCTFDDVVVENIFTTNMPLMLEVSGYRNTIYTKHFPTGSWLGVKELALPEFMIEIEMEVHKAEQ